jgi:ankyrin repeat protein
MADAPGQSSWRSRYPLHAAACCVDDAALRALVLPATLLNDLDEEGRAALHYSAWNGLVATTKALLELGADPNVRSGDRCSTPLHFAAGMGHLACVRLLLQHGADSLLVDIDKWTPLDLAKQDLVHSADRPAIETVLQDAASCFKRPASIQSPST